MKGDIIWLIAKHGVRGLRDALVILAVTVVLLGALLVELHLAVLVLEQFESYLRPPACPPSRVLL